MPERKQAAPRVGDGHFALRTVESIGKLDLGNDHLRDFAVLAGAREAFPRIVMKQDMQHHLAKRRIGGMAVGVPSRGFRVDFQRPGFVHTIDFHRRLEEIRTGAAVPLAKLDDAHRPAVGAAEIPAKGPGKPQRLQFQFLRQAPHRPLFKRQRRVPHGFQQKQIGHDSALAHRLLDFGGVFDGGVALAGVAAAGGGLAGGGLVGSAGGGGGGSRISSHPASAAASGMSP